MVVRIKVILVMGLLLSLGAIGNVSNSEDVVAEGRRQLPGYEADVYGPLPFSEQVTGFLVHELNYILKRQNTNGSWDSAQPMGNGRSTTEAGGTVGNVTLTAMCGHALRSYVEYGPETYDDAIERALRFVTYMVNSGKLRNNVIDAPWHYIYSLRFLASEYPRVKDPLLKKQVEDACAVIVGELKDTQHGTYGQRSIPVRWEKRSNPGLIVKDTETHPGMVVQCDVNGPAFAAGMRTGDRLLTANDELVDTSVRYAVSELGWVSGDIVEFRVLRGDKFLMIQVKLPGQYPGTLGLKTQDHEEGLTIAGFEFLSNRDLAPLQLGDRILKVDDHVIAKRTDLDRLSLYAGQKVELQVQRNGKTYRFDYVSAPVPAADFGVVFPGGRFDQGTQDGLPIHRFTVGSCLKSAGLREGDRLLRIDGALVLNRRHFGNLTRSLWGGKRVTVSYLSGEQQRKVEVTTGSLPHERWLKGYHGLKLGNGAVVESVSYGSTADKAGCKSQDRLLEINGTPVTSDRQANSLLSAVAAGKLLAIVVLRDGQRKQITFAVNRPADSVWIAGRQGAGGGWGYLTGVRGSSTFMTSDALRELLKAKRAMPRLEVPDQMLSRAFLMLSKLRMKQLNSDVESYRYDAAGSFWRVQDIRGDVGRLNSAELACLMYSDTDLPDSEYARTQEHLEKTLREWLKHRGILDLVKFPSDHADYSIAPWFWMYSYRTTLEAADYLTINDELKEEVRRIALRAFFKHMEYRYEPKLEAVGWIMGGDLTKELHDSCQLLDGLATMKHLYRPRVEVVRAGLPEVMKPLYETRYGEAYRLIQKMIAAGKTKDREVAAEVDRILLAINDRFDTRLLEVEDIHRQNPFDGLYHLESMTRHFQGYPRMTQVEELAEQWRQRLPKLPPSEERQWVALGPYSGAVPAGESEHKAWGRILALKTASPPPVEWDNSIDLIESVDPAKDALRGVWNKADGQLVSSEKPYARIQFTRVPRGSYRLETQFTRIRGDCLAIMFPVENTSALLVVSGWKGKVSGLAFVRGKDADRNETTRDGKLSNDEKHTLLLEVRMLDNERARIAVWLDSKAYLDWEGERSALTPDRYWGLRNAGSVGLARIMRPSCFTVASCRRWKPKGERRKTKRHLIAQLYFLRHRTQRKSTVKIRATLLILIGLIVWPFASQAESQDATKISALMPQVADFTSMWWAEGFPSRVPNAPWQRCVQTGHYAVVLDTETLHIPHFGPVPPGTSYATCGRSDVPVWQELPPAELTLEITVDGTAYLCTAGGKWTQFTGPRLIESGRFMQRADVTDLVFTSADGEPLNVEARLETAAWPDRLGLILAARPGLELISAGDACFGRVGGGFGLDGTNHLEIPHSPELDSERFTLELWAFVPANYRVSKRTPPWLVCKNRHEEVDGNFGIVIQNGKPQARMNIGGGRANRFVVEARSGPQFKLDAWNHLAMSYDGDFLRFYVNGVAAGEQRIGRKRISGRDTLVFGRRQDNSGDGYRFRGAVDEIRLYDRALKPAEVRQSFARPEVARPASAPVRQWSFRADGQASTTKRSERWQNAEMEIRLRTAKGVLRHRWELPADQTWSAPQWNEVFLALNPASFQAEEATSPVTVQASELPGGRALTVDYAVSRGWHRVDLNGIEPVVPPGEPEKQGSDRRNDAIERVKLVLTNPTQREQVARLLFEKDGRGIRQRIGVSITGISAILRDADGHPTGIPVQLSKNWHNRPEGRVYAEAWFHGFSQLRLPAASTIELELTLAYGHWGGVAAASHAQLCLIGWGTNQRWDESALGSWGESICYEPDQVHCGCSILDVRPVMVRSMNTGKLWSWTNNVGGGDFFRLFDRAGERISHAAMRATYERHGPCLTDVTYSGRLGKGIRHAATVSLARTDDVVRGTYRLRLDVHETTEFSRFVIFQIGADTYSYTRERKLALGNETGLLKQWATEWGGDTYRTQPVECTGPIPWISLHEGGPRAKQDGQGAWANRGIVIRCWNARLGGKSASPWIAERGVTIHGTVSSTLDVLPPPGVTRLEPGDFVEATIEHIVMPQFAKDYYGPNKALRAALIESENTWHMIHREAAGNNRRVEISRGTLERVHPDVCVRTENGNADFTLAGGLGYVPITFTGLTSSRGYTLLVNGQRVDQSVHGNDFWQTDYNATTKRWSQTYNVPVTDGSPHSIQFTPAP